MMSQCSHCSEFDFEGESGIDVGSLGWTWTVVGEMTAGIGDVDVVVGFGIGCDGESGGGMIVGCQICCWCVFETVAVVARLVLCAIL